MTNFSRRQFAQFGGSALAGAIALRSGVSLAAEAVSAMGAPNMEQRLAPIAPELRPAARQIVEMTAKMPPFTAENLRTMPMPQMPKVELLTDIPVSPREIPGVGSRPAVKVFVINSDPTKRRPAILHTHGGGFILGNAEISVRPLQDVAKALDCTIVTVDYRLAPETRYTGSIEDNYTGLKWLYDHATELGVDRSRIALMGESAGGGHAALLAIRARDRGEIPIVLQVLIYPMLDDRTGSSRKMPAHVGTVGWDESSNRLGWESFLGEAPGTANVPVAAVPARLQNLAGLAPAFIGVGSVDLFADEDMEYARRLSAANVPTELLVIPGAFHGFDQVAANTKPAQIFTKLKLNALRRAFGLEVEV